MIRVENLSYGHEGLIRYNDGSLKNGWIDYEANSAGGVSIRYSVRNYGSKPVRKAMVTFAPYNGVGEPVRCTAQHRCMVSNEMTSGPYVPNKIYGPYISENMWYNWSIKRVSVEKISVEYTDGTTEECEGNYQPKQDEAAAAKSEDNKTFFGSLFILLLGIAGLLIMGYFILDGLGILDLFGKMGRK
ncbi:MAG: hypothetical protein K6F27_02100 [Ruminococcus sp.]|nr:hypothetical protein [Ruminococcus sp.]